MGGDIQNPIHGRLKYSMKTTHLPEIRYSCPDWLERLRQSQRARVCDPIG